MNTSDTINLDPKSSSKIIVEKTIPTFNFVIRGYVTPIGGSIDDMKTLYIRNDGVLTLDDVREKILSTYRDTPLSHCNIEVFQACIIERHEVLSADLDTSDVESSHKEIVLFHGKLKFANELVS